MNEIILIGFYVFVLLYSVIIHEISHGIAALWLGDPTAKYAKRITLNPVSHIDPMLTIVTPIVLLIISQGRFAFGGARPVPYNPYNLKNQKWGPLLVALAGPASNILIALTFAVIAGAITIPLAAKIDIISNFNNWSVASEVISNSIGAICFELSIMIIFWNVLLAFFNLIPFPPLDGSKVLFFIFPMKIETMAILEQYGFIFLLIFIVLFSGPLNIFLSAMLNLFLNLTV